MPSFLTFSPFAVLLAFSAIVNLLLYLPKSFPPSLDSSLCIINTGISLKEIIHLGSLPFQNDTTLIRAERENGQNTPGVVSLINDKQ